MQHGIHSTFDTHSALCMDHYECHSGSVNVIHYHHSRLQNCLARLIITSLSLTLSLPLPLDEPVVIDAKEDKELASSDMSARCLYCFSPHGLGTCCRAPTHVAISRCLPKPPPLQPSLTPSRHGHCCNSQRHVA